MISIGTDIGNLILENTLDKNTIGLNNSIERMTTGYKINRAKDDAAGYSIATDLNTKISSMLMVQQNTEQGISLLQTAESGLDNIMTLLQRLRDLAEQAGNEVYGDDSRAAMQAEADEIIEQIEQIRNTTNFNGINLFEGQPAGGNGGVTTTSATRANRILSNSNVHINGVNGENISGHSERSEESQTTPASVLDTIDKEIKTLSSSIKSNVASQTQSNTFTLPAPRAADIQGAVEIAGNSTQVVNIDGVDYTVTNRISTSQSFSYTKDTTTGEVTFLSSDFTIKGQLDVEHKLIIEGKNNYVYTGDLADTVTINSTGNTIYTYDGDDSIELSSTGTAHIYAGAGNDTINKYAGNANYSIYGESGNDTINLYAGAGIYGRVYGGDGSDTFNIYSGNNYMYGDAGDDVFNIYSGISNLIDGGIGTNTFTGSLSGNTAVNVVGANANGLTLNASETQMVTINGINYSITNRLSYAQTVVYTVASDGTITFSKAGSLIIEGEKNKSHKVNLQTSGTYFHGGDLSDTVVISTVDCQVWTYGGNDIITINSDKQNVFAGDGDDIINVGAWGNNVYGEGGNDDIRVTANTIANRVQFVDGGEGDDKFSISSNVSNVVVAGGAGTNTITDNGVNTLKSGFSDVVDNAQSLTIAPGSSGIIRISETGQEYTVINRSMSGSNYSNFSNTILYSYNPVTGDIILGGANAIIEALQKDIQHNIILSSNFIHLTTGNESDTISEIGRHNTIYSQAGDDNITLTGMGGGSVYAGSGDDFIINNGSSHVYGEDGDDTITINYTTTSAINGGTGNDTYNINEKATNISDTGGNNIYYINTDNSSISGSTGDDTFYVNGNNNTILGQGGNDYYILAGNNNISDGGTGNNYFVDNGSGNNYTNVVTDPNSGMLNFTYQGETKTFTIDGKTYTVTNNASGINSLQYSLNPNTGVITLDGSNFTTTSEADAEAILNIRGDNNTINGSNLNDRITVESGSNNVINGKDGNDTLISNSENNSLNGDNGSDTITINASTNQTVTGGNGDDTININSDNNTNISTGAGNDRVTGTGDNNTVNVESGNNNVLLNGNTNTISAGDGDNRLSVVGNDNTITSGNGANTIGVDGDNNTVSNGNGDSVFNILGDTNQVTTQDGNNELNISGDTNTITSGNGDDEYTVTGDNNTITTTGGNNEVELTGNENNYTGGVGVDDITIRGDRNHAEGGDSNDEFMISRGDNNYIDGNAGDRNTMINNGVDTEYYNVIDITPNPLQLNFKVDIGSSSDNYIGIELSFNLFDFDVDFSSVDGAIEALDAIDDLMSNVTRQLSIIGATINRLESAADAQDVKLNNLISSLSTIKDADIAVESSNFIRYQILQNATVTLMSATRNLRRENVLGIINGIR